MYVGVPMTRPARVMRGSPLTAGPGGRETRPMPSIAALPGVLRTLVEMSSTSNTEEIRAYWDADAAEMTQAVKAVGKVE